MDIKRDTPEFVDVVAILREQLKDTLLLGAYVQNVEGHFHDRNKGVLDLLRSMSREVWTLSELIDCRAAACGSARTHVKNTDPLLNRGEDDSLESLLNRFCRYVRKTSERLVAVRPLNDRETIELFDRILAAAKTGIWFLDVYSNAVWLKCAPSHLPKWKSVSALRQIAS